MLTGPRFCSATSHGRCPATRPAPRQHAAQRTRDSSGGLHGTELRTPCRRDRENLAVCESFYPSTSRQTSASNNNSTLTARVVASTQPDFDRRTTGIPEEFGRRVARHRGVFSRAKIEKWSHVPVGAADGVVMKQYKLRRLTPPQRLVRRSLGVRAYSKAYHLELVGIPTARRSGRSEWFTSWFVRRNCQMSQGSDEAARKTHRCLHGRRLLASDLKPSNIVANDKARRS